jgi:hypothetical protein
MDPETVNWSRYQIAGHIYFLLLTQVLDKNFYDNDKMEYQEVAPFLKVNSSVGLRDQGTIFRH